MCAEFHPVVFRFTCPTSWSQYFLWVYWDAGSAFICWRTGPCFSFWSDMPQPGWNPLAWQRPLVWKLTDCVFRPWPIYPCINTWCALVIFLRSSSCVYWRSGEGEPDWELPLISSILPLVARPNTSFYRRLSNLFCDLCVAPPFLPKALYRRFLAQRSGLSRPFIIYLELCDIYFYRSKKSIVDAFRVAGWP